MVHEKGCTASQRMNGSRGPVSLVHEKGCGKMELVADKAVSGVQVYKPNADLNLRSQLLQPGRPWCRSERPGAEAT